MKIIFLFLGVLIFTINNTHSQSYYYWENDVKHPLELSTQKSYVVSSIQNKSVLADALSISETKISDTDTIIIPNSLQNGSNSTYIQKGMYWSVVDDGIFHLQVSDSKILYTAPFFLINGKETGLSQFFYVKLREQGDSSLLYDLAQSNKVAIIGNNKFMPLWYVLACDMNSSGNALEMANKFYETRRFAIAQPDFTIKMTSGNHSFKTREFLTHRLNNKINALYSVCPVNDTYFSDSWHLQNTGLYGGSVGNDINICPVWNITQGCNSVVVAVIDDGVELNHPDFSNISTISYDAVNGTSPSILRGPHGTAVAGILGATTNNGTGVAGVASEVQLMSISISYGSFTPLRSLQFADAINFAWQNGASVINCSWGVDPSAPNQSPILDAIDDAVTSGRSGLGTIMVFSTGNGNTNVIDFPSSHSEVLAVGAMSMCNERKFEGSTTSCDTESWGSNYGTNLDVMAPGVLIPTTDVTGSSDGYNSGIPIHILEHGSLHTSDYLNTSYTRWFNGTSSAAPQVSGIAALILSVNPGLTQQEVRDIIINTADKVVGYTYNNGWNDEMGYGRVNAYNALLAAIPTAISGPSLVCNSSTAYSIPGLPAGATVQWSASPAGIAIVNSPASATTSISKQSFGTITLQAVVTV